MSKLIINTDGLSDALALRLVLNVVNLGRVSDDGKCYCFVTTFQTEQGEVLVAADRTCAGSDTFSVWKT